MDEIKFDVRGAPKSIDKLGDYKKYVYVKNPKRTRVKDIDDDASLEDKIKYKIGVMNQFGIGLTRQGKKRLWACKNANELENFYRTLMKAFWEVYDELK